MKHIFTLALFAAPFVVSAQEQPASNKRTSTPPTTSEKSISDKGVSAPKSRSVNPKPATETKAPAPAVDSHLAPATETQTATSGAKPKN